MQEHKLRVAWGITGSGDKIAETIEVMKKISRELQDRVDIRAYVSIAGEQMLTYYRLMDDLEKNFRVSVEKNSNAPFLAGALQLRKFDFFLIAPATSNTVTKIALGIADTMLSNAAIMALKAFVPVYIMPVDIKEGITSTILPDGKTLKIRVRKEDADNVRKLTTMDGVVIIEKPGDIRKALIDFLPASQNLHRAPRK